MCLLLSKLSIPQRVLPHPLPLQTLGRRNAEVNKQQPTNSSIEYEEEIQSRKEDRKSHGRIQSWKTQKQFRPEGHLAQTGPSHCNVGKWHGQKEKETLVG